jgi:signal transduction histidine kinase
VLTVVIFGAVAVVLARRMTRSGEVMRRILGPVLAVAAVRTVALGAYLIERRHGPLTGATDALGWAYVLSLPALTLAFAGGVLAHRLFVAGALEQLTATLSSRPGPRRLRAALAGALRDPLLLVLYPMPDAPGRWTDGAARPVEPPAGGAGRSVTFVGHGPPTAAVVHDADLDLDPALLEGVSAYVGAALQNRHLLDQLRESLADLASSRARIVEAADDERRRIERDLHDGAQQRLVALQINLELLAERLDLASPDDARHVRALEDDIDVTLDEVRRFGRGLYPPLLAERGLRDALRAVTRGAALPTTVDVRLSRRYPTSTESAVYFSCVEGLQNAVKHARGATAVWIRATGGDALRFEVADDGAGFDPATTAQGTGLTNLRDRIEALGGSLEIHSAPGRGTRVIGVVPAQGRSSRVPCVG